MPKERITTQKKRKTGISLWYSEFEVGAPQTSASNNHTPKVIGYKPNKDQIKKISKCSLFGRPRRGLFNESEHASFKKNELSRYKASQEIITALGIPNMSAANYLPSIMDKHTLFSVKPVHVLKEINGYGLFANEPIDSGVCIGEYMGAEYSRSAFRTLVKENKTSAAYAMEAARRIIDGEIVGNFLRYINYSDSHANVEFIELKINTKIHITVVTKEPIAAGQQLLVDYNIYNESISRSYLFLNPQDNWQSTAELYEKHSQHYLLTTSDESFARFGIKQDDQLYLTQVARCIIDDEAIKERSHVFDETVDLPYLTLKNHQEILDITEADLYTPLMVACYEGQHSNVEWLIRHGANVDQQQNKSGNCPLFFALEGYSGARTHQIKYVNVLKKLIVNNANITIHDREDKTFLHKAIAVLSTQHLTLIMRCILDRMPKDIITLYDYIDSANNDIVMYCLETRFFDKLSVLLSFYPHYFDEILNHSPQQQQKVNKEKLRGYLESYSEDEKEELSTYLEAYGVDLDNHLTPTLSRPSR